METKDYFLFAGIMLLVCVLAWAFRVVYIHQKNRLRYSKKPRSFKVIQQDDPERIQISFEDIADIYLIRTPEGFIFDVYNTHGEDVRTATVWYDDLDYPRDWTDDLSEDEQPTDDFIISDVELDDFIAEWGQKHKEICANLNYDPKTSDDILMLDYFWYPSHQQWIPKCASMYTEHQQQIADFLRNSC
jgi:hypothetical protein